MSFPDIQSIANGSCIPPGVALQMQKEEERQEQIDNLERISYNMQKQIELMEKQIENYKNENKNSKKQSRISMIISIIAIVATIASSIIPQLFSLLGL